MTHEAQEILDQIEEMKRELAALQKEYDEDIDPSDFTEQFDEMLDSAGDIVICGASFSPSKILKNLDNIAYREALKNYADGAEKDEIPRFCDLKDQIWDLEADLEDLETVLKDLEEEQ